MSGLPGNIFAGTRVELGSRILPLTCWNIERVLDTERMGKPKPEDITVVDFLKEGKHDN